jgi:uncharacterized SAM-binding protein YcdF (DUF218 family)
VSRRRTRRIIYSLLVATIVVAGYVVALWPVYVDPVADDPAPADAIVVLGGPHFNDRVALGLQLAEEGYAPRLVVSNTDDDDRNHHPDDPLNRICDGKFAFTVACFAPDPDTTRGEGREIARRAKQEQWRRVIVVTFTPHVSRARYIIGKCFEGELLMVPVRPRISPSEWTYTYLYQSLGYLRAFFEDC